MPRYFFDFDDVHVHDDEGVEVETSAEIEATATRALLDIARHEGPSVFGNPTMLGKDGGAIVINVRGVEAEDMFTLRLAFTVTPE